VLNGGLFGLFANQVTTISQAQISAVKDVSVVASDVGQIEEESSDAGQITIQDEKPLITVYTVKSGDTLSTIASQFSISTNTILWANDLTKKSVVRVGQKLTILPVSGVVYTVGKGNTLGGIAAKFDVDIEEIISFNDLEEDKTIRVGMKLIIPNGELPVEKKPVVEPVKVAVKKEVKTEIAKTAVVEKTEEKVVSEKTEVIEEKPTTSSGYFTHPIPGSVLTQGAHGYNSVDFGAPVGTPVLASAEGKVIVAKPSGYNGGYGKNIVIEHANGTQTLYAHLSSVSVSVDDEVTKGQQIALSGNTGRSTGPHLHFEVRGGTNPWVGIKKLTKF
jgi:murein DD-endopeptidase MepM/ murein hydrolase activator NlpD